MSDSRTSTVAIRFRAPAIRFLASALGLLVPVGVSSCGSTNSRTDASVHLPHPEKVLAALLAAELSGECDGDADLSACLAALERTEPSLSVADAYYYLCVTQSVTEACPGAVRTKYLLADAKQALIKGKALELFMDACSEHGAFCGELAWVISLGALAPPQSTAEACKLWGRYATNIFHWSKGGVWEPLAASFVLGVGTPVDVGAAAEALQAGCERDSAVACRLLAAYARNQGELLRAAELAVRPCVTSGDFFACAESVDILMRLELDESRRAMFLTEVVTADQSPLSGSALAKYGRPEALVALRRACAAGTGCGDLGALLLTQLGSRPDPADPRYTEAIAALKHCEGGCGAWLNAEISAAIARGSPPKLERDCAKNPGPGPAPFCEQQLAEHQAFAERTYDCLRGSYSACQQLFREGSYGPSSPNLEGRLRDMARQLCVADGTDWHACLRAVDFPTSGDGERDHTKYRSPNAREMLKRACEREPAPRVCELKSCSYPTGEACRVLGRVLEDDGQTAKAGRYYDRGCQVGYSAACFEASRHHAPKAVAAVLSDLEEACGENLHGPYAEYHVVHEACIALGRAYEEGYGGLERDVERALELYASACGHWKAPLEGFEGPHYLGPHSWDSWGTECSALSQFYKRRCERGRKAGYLCLSGSWMETVENADCQRCVTGDTSYERDACTEVGRRLLWGEGVRDGYCPAAADQICRAALSSSAEITLGLESAAEALWSGTGASNN